MKQQSSGLFDPPPTNLPSNFIPLTDNKTQVVGYFSVANEQTTRWYFNINDLSYKFENNLVELCKIEYGTPEEAPAPECTGCLNYTNGNSTIEMPAWWRK